MPRIVLVEPAGNIDHPGAGSVGRAASGDTLYFPHVDSCLAIVFIMEDDAAIGAHVGLMGPPGVYIEPQGDDNAKLAIVQMKTLAGDKKILNVFTLGDPQDYKPSIFLSDVTNKAVMVGKVPGGGVDITVDPKLQVITVVECLNKAKTEWKFSALGQSAKSI